jgi:hypothetical protein
MELLKDKKLLVGGLAVIGGIALVSYLLKSKAPKRNSEGFFNAGGITVPNIPPITPPNMFRRQDRFCKVCVQYEKTINSKGFPEYTKRLMPTPYTVSLEKFSISEQEFNLAFTKNGLCTVNPPTK